MNQGEILDSISILNVMKVKKYKLFY